MIPVKLTLKGLYSYQKEQTIDFANLIDGQIFGIFGPVGSGKSTILEAVSFALYGETERLNKSGDDRYYNMMNLKSDELFIDFIFHTGNKEEFRFTVSGKRNTSKFEDVKTFERKAYKKHNRKWEPLEKTTADEIIGLSYQNFRRTIIIPQNKFQEFLQLGSADRTRMLKEIFNLDRFELSDKVTSLERKTNERKENLQGKLQQIGDISEDMIEQKKQELSEFEKNEQKISETLTIKKKQEKELDETKKLFDILRNKEKELDQLQNQKKSYDELESQIKDHEYCLIHFKPLLDKQQEIGEKITELENETKTKKGLLSQTDIALKKAEVQFQQIKETYNQREKLTRKTEELAKILEIKSLDRDINSAEKDIEREMGSLENTKKKIMDLQEKEKSVKEVLKQRKKEMPNQAELSNVKNWFTNKNNINKRIQDVNKEISSIQNELKQQESQKKDKIPTELIQQFGINIKEPIEEILTGLGNLKNNVKRKLQELDSNEKHLLAQEKLEEIVENMKEGEPCPVCGSTEHPRIITIESVKRELQSIQKEIKSIQKQDEQISNSIQSLKELSAQVREQQKILSKRNDELVTEKNKLQNHLTRFSWKKYSPDDEEKINETYRKVQKLLEDIEKFEDDLEKTQIKINDNNKTKENIERKLNQLNETQKAKDAKRNTLHGQLKLLHFDD